MDIKNILLVVFGKIVTDQFLIFRYFLDHTVYTIARVYEEELPSESAIIYKWPEDLLKPDYHFLLNDLNTSYGKALSVNQYKFVER